MSMRQFSARRLVPVLLPLAACSGDAASVPGPRAPASMVVVSGDGQTGPVGEKLPQPLVVRVLDAGGNPLPGQVVNFRVASGRGADIFAGAAMSDAQGLAADRWTLGTLAGEGQRVEVRSVTSTGQELVHAVFQAAAVPGPPAKVQASSIFTFTAVGDTQRIRAVVHDRFNNPVPDARLYWWVRAFDSTAVVVDTTGLARSTANGTRQVIVRAGGLETVRDTVSVTVFQVPVSLAMSPDTAVMTAGTTRQFTASLYDRNGYPVPRTIGWRSYDTTRVRVSSTGLVTAVAPGSALVQAAKSGFSDTATVTVVP